MNRLDDDRWLSYDVTGAFLEEQAAWLSGGRTLHSGSLRFFEESGALVSFSRYHYPLASVAFFHAIPGVECALKLHYQKAELPLSELLLRALDEKLIKDSLFTHRKPFTERFAKMVDGLVEEQGGTHSQLLVSLVPKLRNQYFHGTYLLAPDYLHLTFQLREIADALITRQPTPTPNT